MLPTAKLPAHWYPVQTKGLVRLGSNWDGGYIVPETLFDKTDILLSCGLEDNWEFEEDFQTRSGCKVLCYDHTVDENYLRKLDAKRLLRVAKRIVFLTILYKRFSSIKRLFLLRAYRKFFDGKKAIHHRIKIGYDHPEINETSLRSILAAQGDKNIFIKMDIESGEYRALEQMAEHGDKLLGIVLELHDMDLHHERIERWLKQMHNYSLVHIHWTGAGVEREQDGMPYLMEWTLLRSDLVEPTGETPDYPIPDLDSPCPNNTMRLQFEGR